MSDYQIQTGTIFESFETIGDWTISGGTASIDSTIFKTGTGSLKLVSGSGTNCIATKTISLDASRFGRMSFDVYIEDVTQVSSIQTIISSDAAFAKFFTRTLAGTSLRNGWNTIRIGRSVWGNTGGDAWENTMVRLRVRVNALTAVSPVVYYDNFTYGGYNRPKVVWICDDGFESQYSELFTYIKSKGYRFPFTCALIQARIDGDGGVTYMTTAQITEMHTAGVALVNHTVNHSRLDNFPDATTMIGEFYPCTLWLQSLGFTRNNEHLFFVYPNGGYNATVIAALQSKGMIAARSILTDSNLSQSTPVDSPYVLVTRNLGNTTTLASAKAAVDTAISNGSTFVVESHKFVASPVADTEFPISDMQALVDYIMQYATAGVLDIMTFPDWYRGLNTPRRQV